MSIMWPYPAVFNVLDPWWNSGSGYKPLIPNDTTKAVDNTNALLEIIALAQASNDQSATHYYGAIIVFPGHAGVPNQGDSGADAGGIYYFQGPGDGSPTIPILSNWPIKFLGTGSVKLVNYYDTTDSGFILGDFFSIVTDGQYDSNPSHTLGENLGGMTFENITFQFPSANTQGGVAAIHTALNPFGGNGGAQNVRINACVFTDCPIGVWFEEGLQCSLFQCTANWAEINGTALKIGGPNVSGVKPFGKDIFVTDCIFEITHNAPAGNIGLDLIAAEHVRLKGVRFDGFDTGILIRPGYAAEGETPSTFNVVRCYFEDVTVFAGKIGTVETGPAGNGLTIQPQNDTDVGQLCFVGCTFEPGINPDITSTSPGVAGAGAGTPNPVPSPSNGSLVSYTGTATGELLLGSSASSVRCDYGETSAGNLTCNSPLRSTSSAASSAGAVPPCYKNDGTPCNATFHLVKNSSSLNVTTNGACANNTWCTLNNASVSFTAANAQFANDRYNCTLSSTSAYLLNPLANNQTTTGFQIQAFNSSGSSIAGGSDLGLTYACFGI